MVAAQQTTNGGTYPGYHAQRNRWRQRRAQRDGGPAAVLLGDVVCSAEVRGPPMGPGPPCPWAPPDALAIMQRRDAHAWRWSTCGPLRAVRDWAICSHSIMLHLDQNTKELDPGSQPTDKPAQTYSRYPIVLTYLDPGRRPTNITTSKIAQ